MIHVNSSATAGRGEPRSRWRNGSLVPLLGSVLIGLLVIFIPTGAHADAASGSCATGYKLGEYSYSKPAYNHAGEKMFSISVRKRWCYSDKKNKIGSVYTSKPSVKIYSYFGNAW